jgi:HPt (histidine-containing phosphotransfer) domain-containing protein
MKMVTDLTYLNNMSGGNSEIIKEMIEIFNEQSKHYIVDMQKYLDEKNYSLLGKLAHKAKSSVAIMGMNELADDLKTLEIKAKEGKDPETYPGYVEKFIGLTKQAIAELEEIAAKL